jgi:hypothetical protein
MVHAIIVPLAPRVQTKTSLGTLAGVTLAFRAKGKPASPSGVLASRRKVGGPASAALDHAEPVTSDFARPRRIRSPEQG